MLSVEDSKRIQQIFRTNAGLISHIMLETPALIGFLMRPSQTLSSPATPAHGLIRQYGLLLLCTNLLIALTIVYEPTDSEAMLLGYRRLEQVFAQVLLVYHVGPIIRAMARIRHGELGKNLFGDPYLHLLLHIGCVAALCNQGFR